MTDRLSVTDVSFLFLEGRSTPMHVGELAIYEPPESGFDYDALVALIEERISLVPRYRQKVAWVPGNLANPVWVDDAEFDISYHVRRSGLPRPGSDEQLHEFCARIQARPLDRQRPLWEMYLIEGLSGGRVAIATKTHHSMVDGVDSVDIGQVILDVSPVPRHLPPSLWMPRPKPGRRELLLGAVGDILRRPTSVADAVRMGVGDVRSSAARVSAAVHGVVSAVSAVIAPPPSSPLNRPIGEQRRFAVARTSLADYRAVHQAQNAPVNDVILATVAGALRGWLLFRGESVGAGSTLRAMVPVSVRTDAVSGAGAAPAGNAVSALFVDLPVGEPSPLMRLAQVGYATRAHRESPRSVDAEAIVAFGGFAPPTLHAMGARVTGGLTRRMYNVVVTNVPGPQVPLYAAGARLLEMFPITPLAQGQALAIGLTSYDGGVFFGLNADRDAMPDVDVIASLLEESLAELLAASEATVARPRAVPTRGSAARGRSKGTS